MALTFPLLADLPDLVADDGFTDEDIFGSAEQATRDENGRELVDPDLVRRYREMES